ncbi:peptidylprolyl isomerase [Marinobacteraceae bacterium S3BR75-40.1]
MHRISRLALLFIALILLTGHLHAEQRNPRVALETNQGRIVLELLPARAPKTVANFLQYVDEGFYEDTLFHRVIPGFMIQGGGYDKALQRKQAHPAIENESRNGLKNLKGTVAMARRGDPHSATAQFFINLVDNRHLDATPGRWGYTVFGKVIKGWDTVEQIAERPTTRRKGMANVPQQPVVIKAIHRLEQPDNQADQP